MAEFEHIDGLSVGDSDDEFEMANPSLSQSTPKKKTKALPYVPPNKIINRLIVCLFAMCLLWITSLQICTSVVNIFIAIPPFSAVVDQCTVAYDFMVQEQESYVTCVDNQLKACNKNLHSAYATELARVSTNQASNDAFLSSYTSLVNNCSIALTNTKSALSAWTSLNGIYYPVPYKESCTGQQKQAVLSLLGDTSSSSNSIYATMMEYTQSSDTAVGHLAAYSVALNQYNADYLNNKTKSMQNLAQKIVQEVSLPHLTLINASLNVPMTDLLNNVVACVSLSNTSGTCNDVEYSARYLYDNYKHYVNAVQGQVTNTFTILTSQIADLNARIQTAVANANSFYDSVVGTQGIINWVVKNLNGAGSFNALCGRSSPNFCSFSESDWFIGWYFPQYFPKVVPMPDASYFWSSVSPVVDSAQLQVAHMAANLTEAVSAMVNDIQLNIAAADFTPDDYNPPRYEYAGNASMESHTQTRRSQTFLTAVQDILTHTVNTSIVKATVSIDFNSTVKTSSQSLSKFSTSWSSFSFGGISFKMILESILTIKGLFFLFDYLYRIFQTVRLVSRFWSKGVVHLPKADVRSNKDDFNSPILPYVGYALQLLPFIWLQLLMLIFLVAIIAWTIASVAVPEYNSYMGACVYHTSNSTFLSRGMYAASFNYAAMDGNADITKGVVAYNVLTASYCAANSASSLYTYNNLVNSMLSKNQSLQGLINNHDQVTSCLNMTAMDSHFISACCNEAAYRYRWASRSCDTSHIQCPVSDSIVGAVYLPPSTYLNSHAYCQRNSTALLYFQSDTQDGMLQLSNFQGQVTNSVFQCSALPNCKVTCSGPDTVLLEAVTKSCSCMTEWYLNGYMLQISIALVTYILVNVARSLICIGLVKVNWKTLTPKIFEFTANCDTKGNFLVVKATRVVSDEEEQIKNDNEDDKSTVDSEGKENVTDNEEKADFDLQSALQADLQKKIRMFVWKGYGFIALGILINVPWMYLLYIMKRDIAYKP